MADPAETSGTFGRWRAICLDCRTALEAVGDCDGGEGHRVVDLMTPEGQEALLDEVWPPPALPANPEPLFQLAAPAPPIAARRRNMRPFGAPSVWLRQPRKLAGRGVAEGRVARSPLGREPCLAYGLTLLVNRPAVPRRDVVWREAATIGFTVRLEDGALVRVPAGRVRFEVDRHRAYYAPRAHAANHLPGALGIRIIGELDFVPFDEALEDVLRPGDRVELLGSVELREDRTAERPSPRAPAPTMLVPIGTPRLRRLD